MGEVFQTLDIVIFFAALIGVMGVGLFAGRKDEETSEDYFLASRKIPWWGVAGSIYGSNVSANHMVGMMGVGFTVGFAQSHFELGAIFGLMVLCYFFLPVYRKLRVFTLSEYLEKRYDHRSRLVYSIIMTVIMAVIHLVPGLYIGSRTICTLLGGEAAVESEMDTFAGVTVAQVKAADEAAPGIGVSSQLERAVVVNWNHYAFFVIALALVAAGYTIVGGLTAVVWTDFIQSMLLLAAGLLIAVLTFWELVPDGSTMLAGVWDGWGQMLDYDKAVDAGGGRGRMHLYLPSNHQDLPWTGVFTGLLAMHCYYWGTNQFIVQRALGARSDSDARLGIVAAGFLKLLIPFFAIGTGVAAFYLFDQKLPDRKVASDAAFSEVVKLVIPAGYGLIGLISAGLIGAILSSIDSMMNSAATLFTIDVYKRYVKPDASDRDLIRVGRIAIVFFVAFATVLALFALDPNSEKSFFLQVADYQNFLTPGLLIAFFLGMFWKRGTATAAFLTIIAGVLFSWVAESVYNDNYGMNPAIYQVVQSGRELDSVKLGELPESMRTLSYVELVAEVDNARTHLNSVNAVLGPKLNFFHRVVIVLFASGFVFFGVSLLTRPDDEKSKLNWTELGGHSSSDLKSLVSLILLSILIFAVIGAAMVNEWLIPGIAAVIAAMWTLAVFQFHIASHRRKNSAESDNPDAAASKDDSLVPLTRDDRFWASLLCSAAVFMHYYYY
jgi:solute:Na+ symporter, SSS family